VLWILAAGLVLAGLLLRATGSRSGRSRLGVCLVVHDQADRVEGLLRGVAAAAGAAPDGRIDLTVVDAGSRDETADLLARLQRQYPGLRTERWGGGLPGALEPPSPSRDGHWVLVGVATGDVDPEVFLDRARSLMADFRRARAERGLGRGAAG
jgi:cellulose synthase/poly-beta-1,6-N-acetylglucosamine synthase-like glycosyltransferase